jgi:hypothetical protein
MIKRITLIPLVSPETGGRFRVWLELGPDMARQASGSGSAAEGEGQEGMGGTFLVWDRKVRPATPTPRVSDTLHRGRWAFCEMITRLLEHL